MNSVERFWEYNKVPVEAIETDDGYEPPEEWPKDGQIEFKSFSFKYFKAVCLTHLISRITYSRIAWY